MTNEGGHSASLMSQPGPACEAHNLRLLFSPMDLDCKQRIMNSKIAVVIPSYRVRRHILQVLANVGAEIWRVYVVDDCCPDHSGDFVKQNCSDPRVFVLRNETNQGVGGAVKTGYAQAIKDGATVIVKMDGDGQMDPRLINHFVEPIFADRADYTKGNRYYDLSVISRMPRVRIFGNAVLSIMAKLSTGYWDLFDPTNGYTAIHANVAERLPFNKISNGYFFETDMLFRLSTFRALVRDVPMDAVYNDDVSNLRISEIWGEFLRKHSGNFFKRIFYNYFLRDFTIASLELIVGSLMIAFGVCYGGYHWISSALENKITPAGTVMLAALPVLFGVQLVLAFFNFDIASVPKSAIHRHLLKPDRSSDA